MTTTLGGSCGFSVVFVNVWRFCNYRRIRKTLRHRRRYKKKRKKKKRRTHEIPPFLLDGTRLAFRDDGPHKLGHGRRRVQLKVERDLVLGRVEEVDEPAEDLERELEKVVSRAEGEDGVEGGDAASARREDEEVAVAVRGQRRGVAARARRCGTRELLLEDA
jgi:hypothetical protein